MKRTLQLLTGLLTGGFLTLAWGQANYTTPYSFVTLAGSPGVGGTANGANTTARFNSPQGVAGDAQGNLYVADYANHAIRKVVGSGTNWVVSTIAGTIGVPGSVNGNNTTASFNHPTAIAVDSLGNLYVADYGNELIRKLTPTGPNWVVTTIAGLAGNADSTDGTNSAARFSDPSGITVDTNGNVYVADSYNSTIRKLTLVGTDWVVTTIAGLAQNYDSTDGTNSAARFFFPAGIAADAAGNLYVADTFNGTIREVAPVGTNWVVTTLAGQAQTFGSDDGPGLNASFNYPFGICADASGNLYVADTYNNNIRLLTPAGTNWMVSTLAGTSSTSGTNDGTGADAQFSSPVGIAVDAAGNVYVGDSANQIVRQGMAAAVPNLSVALTAPNTVVVAWPSQGGYAVQTNSDLTTGNWAVYGGDVTTSNGTNTITFTAPTGSLFFRLSH